MWDSVTNSRERLNDLLVGRGCLDTSRRSNPSPRGSETHRQRRRGLDQQTTSVSHHHQHIISSCHCHQSNPYRLYFANDIQRHILNEVLYLSVCLATYLPICVATGFSPPWTAVILLTQTIHSYSSEIS